MDENSKIGGDAGAPKPTAAADDSAAAGNPNFDVVVTTNSHPNAVEANSQAPGTATDDVAAAAAASRRTPFTNLSQVDADLALARTLQEQERAYMMLSMNGGGIGYGRWDTGIYFHDDEDDDFDDSHDHEYDEGDEEGDDHDEDEDEEDEDDDQEDEDDIDNFENDDEEDAFDVHAHAETRENNAQGIELDPTAFPDDEAYARALQDAEEREMAARLLALAGITEREIVDVEEDHGGHSQDTWEEVDPDELSYEELIALGEVVGTESRGLSADTIASLPSSNYKSQSTQEAETDSCVICRLDYEDGDVLTTLPCKHAYHTECINNWLNINKACPVCSTEVSTSGNS